MTTRPASRALSLFAGQISRAIRGASQTTRRMVILVLAMSFLSGCASTTPGDPFESYNRKMYSVNSALDENILAPTARAYKNYVPLMIRSVTSNFFSNLNDLWIGLNNLLQGKPLAALNDWTRVLLNTTFGFLGISDPASEMGFYKNKEDFGQTMAVWGVPSGPYLVLPLFGPSSIRGTGGLVAGYYADPTDRVIHDGKAVIGASVLGVIHARSKLLGTSNVLKGAALDEYSFVRDAYKQRRRNLIYDGDPPFEDEEDDWPPPDEDDGEGE